MTNPWIEHVRKYAKENNLTYGCAISEAQDTYVKIDRNAKAKKDGEYSSLIYYLFK